MTSDSGCDASSSDDQERLVERGRRTILQTGGVALAASAGCIAGEFPSGETGSSTSGTRFDSPTVQNPSNAREDLQWWAGIPQQSDDGRPLPVTASWNTGGTYNQPWNSEEAEGWTPEYLVSRLDDGHHVLPTFGNWHFVSIRTYSGTNDWQGRMDNQFSNYYEPALSACAERDAPFAILINNLASMPAGNEQYLERGSKDPFETDGETRFIKNGETQGKSSPFGPVDRWREFGEFWFGNDHAQRIQEAYPDPSRIVLIDNNEGGRIGAGAIDKNATRFIEQYGEDALDRKAELLHEGYKERYQALYEGAREAAIDGWGDSLQFTAYNAGPGHSKWFARNVEADDSFTDVFREWEYFEGTEPEFYMNDWQIYRGKSDYSPWSPQSTAMNRAGAQEIFFDEHAPDDYFYGNIGWEGGPPSKRRTATNYYALGNNPLRGPPAVQRWDFDRYEGMLQFGIWAMRPREFREFRGGASRDAYYQRSFDRYVDMVDRVWENDTLREFYRHGDRVPTGDENTGSFIGGTPENPPDWWQEMGGRWLALDCEANPPREEWGGRGSFTALRVVALAVVRGEKPERRWLVYAHAPLGAVVDTSVTIPDYGDVTISAFRSGSFFLVDEADDSVETVIEGSTATDDVTGWDSSTPLGAGSGPEVYDLQFDALSEWEGPWQAVGEPDEWPGELQTYRMTPNAASGPDAPVIGAGLVEDEERGTVLELSGGNEGLWLQRGSRTNGANAKNRTFDLTFKAENTSERQILFTTGGPGKGYNIYLDGGRLYSGTMGGHTDGLDFSGVSNMEDGNYGHFLSTEAPSADEWHRVTMVLEDATDSVEGNKRSLYLDGERVDRGPGAALPNYHGAPHVGHARQTGLHSGEAVGYLRGETASFRGRIARFELRNDARPPD